MSEKEESRMAGDKLEELSAKDEGFRNALERRIGTEEYDRISPSGAQALDDRGRMTRSEAAAEFRERAKGTSVDDMVSEYQKMVDDGTKFNAQAQSFLEGHGVNFGGSGPGSETPPEETPSLDDGDTPVLAAPEPKPQNDPWPFPPGLGGGFTSGMSQQVAQDNDIYTTISGDNNTVKNNQDNSIRQSGGSRYLGDWMRKHNFFN